MPEFETSPISNEITHKRPGRHIDPPRIEYGFVPIKGSPNLFHKEYYTKPTLPPGPPYQDSDIIYNQVSNMKKPQKVQELRSPSSEPTPGTVGYQQIILHGVDTYYDIPKDDPKPKKYEPKPKKYEPKKSVQKTEKPKLWSHNNNGFTTWTKKTRDVNKIYESKIKIEETTTKNTPIESDFGEFWSEHKEKSAGNDNKKRAPETTTKPFKPFWPQNGPKRLDKPTTIQPQDFADPNYDLPKIPVVPNFLWKEPVKPTVQKTIRPPQLEIKSKFHHNDNLELFHLDHQRRTTLPPLVISALPRLIKHTSVLHQPQSSRPFIESSTPATFLVNPSTTVSTLKPLVTRSHSSKSIKVTTSVPEHFHVKVSSHGNDQIDIEAFPIPPVPTLKTQPPFLQESLQQIPKPGNNFVVEEIRQMVDNGLQVSQLPKRQNKFKPRLTRPFRSIKKPKKAFKGRLKTFDKPYKLPLPVKNLGSSTRKLKDFGVYKAQSRSENLSSEEIDLISQAQLHSFDRI